MTLRRKLIFYLVLIHLFFGVVAAFVIYDQPTWFFAIEVVFALSFWLGYRLIHSMFVPLELIGTGSDLIEERDFGTHFLEVGQPEMDHLIEVYNRMIDGLRQERLRTEEKDRLLDRLIESSPSGIVTCDLDGKIESVNPSAGMILGIDAVRLRGRAPEEIDHPILVAISSLDKGESTVATVQGRRRFRCRRAVFLDRGFEKPFFLIDELTEELRAFEKAAYERLIRMVSHEVNNSTGAVRSLLESASNYAGQLSAGDRDDFAHALEVASSRLRNLDRFVNAFADVVRLPELETSPVRVDELIDDIAILMKPSFDARQIRCELDLDRSIGPVAMDKNQMEQVLVNVIKNAVEASDREGEIRISLSRNGSRSATLAIRDSGSGIDPAIASQIFTPFTSSKRDGRGIGLTVVREILSKHRFDFALRNCQDGGAVFEITFDPRIVPE